MGTSDSFALTLVLQWRTPGISTDMTWGIDIQTRTLVYNRLKIFHVKLTCSMITAIANMRATLTTIMWVLLHLLLDRTLPSPHYFPHKFLLLPMILQSQALVQVSPMGSFKSATEDIYLHHLKLYTKGAVCQPLSTMRGQHNLTILHLRQLGL